MATTNFVMFIKRFDAFSFTFGKLGNTFKII